MYTSWARLWIVSHRRNE